MSRLYYCFMKNGIIALLCVWSLISNAQEITLNEVSWSSLTGLQSFTWGSSNGDFIIFGGRVDGLHRRQPFASFDLAGHNTQIQLLQPTTQQVLSMSTADFPADVQEQMHSTNACFTQRDNWLFVSGGYGYSELIGEHTTFNKLLVFDLTLLRNSILSNTSPAISLVAAIEDDLFAVTGGKLLELNDVFYLTVGQRFEGKYNPIGPDHGPGFTQQYTESIRRFTLDSQWNVQWLSAWTDAALLHRRDLNVLPMRSSGGEEQCTIYAGVFQPTLDIPYINAIHVSPQGFNEIPNFAQYYNHYHCATISMYDSIQNSNSHYFFGGISHYYDSVGVLVQNNNVPFVRTIAKVVHFSDGSVQEYLLPVQMPGYLGSGAEFLPLHGIPSYENEIIKSPLLQGDSVLIGYVYGGINSSGKNIFWNNEGDLSTASPLWFEVYYHPSENTSVQNMQSSNGVQLQVYPNPFTNEFHVQFTLLQMPKKPIEINWFDSAGNKIETTIWNKPVIGKNEVVLKDKGNWVAGTYIVQIQIDQNTISQRIVFEP